MLSKNIQIGYEGLLLYHLFFYLKEYYYDMVPVNVASIIVQQLCFITGNSFSLCKAGLQTTLLPVCWLPRLLIDLLTISKILSFLELNEDGSVIFLIYNLIS